MATDMLHRRAALEFGVNVFQRAGYRELFRRPTVHFGLKKATISLQKRDPSRHVPKRLIEGIARLARRAAGEHGVKFRKKIEEETGTHSITFRVRPTQK